MNLEINKLKRILTFLFVLIILMLIIRFAYLSSIYSVYESDDAWNATVSKNFAFEGEYIPSLAKSVFHPVISTGTPVLLLQALVFKIFGISHSTSFLTVLIFALILFVISVLLIGRKSKFYLLGSLFLSILMFSNEQYSYLIVKLYGEIPAIAFSFIAFYILYYIFEINGKEIKDEKKELKICFVAGIFLGLALLTKIIMSFLIISFIGLLIIDIIIYKNFTIKTLVFIISGILLTFVIEYIFRLVQFNFSFIDSFNSVVNHVSDMYMQSRWGNYGEADTSNIITRIQRLHDLCNWNLFPIVYVTLPVFIYIFNIILRKKENLLMIYIGVSASSIYVYYIFFGTFALDSKRLFPFSYVLSCYYIYFILLILRKIFDSKNLNMIIKISLMIATFVFSFVFTNNYYKGTFKDFVFKYTNKHEINKRAREDEYIKILQSIPLNSTIYSICGNPRVMCLYTDLKKINRLKLNDINNMKRFVKEFPVDNKVYLVCDQDDLQLQIENLKKYFDRLKLCGIDYIKLNKIQIDEEYDIYGIYELKLRDRKK